MHGDVDDRAVGEVDARVVLGERAEERRVAGQEGDLAAAERARDDLRGLAGEQHPLGRHELDLHRSAMVRQRLPAGVFALASTCSTPPTLRNACSGTSSSSPLTMASKLSTVSATGTVSPLTPVNTSAT